MDEATLISIWDVRDPRGLPWSHRLPREFQARCGYDLREHLPALVAAVPGAARVRCDYFSTLGALYAEGFLKPVQAWCAAHGIASTGHLLCEEPLAPQVRHQANAPLAYRCFDIPGVDNLTVRTGGLHHRLAALPTRCHRARALRDVWRRGLGAPPWPSEGERRLAAGAGDQSFRPRTRSTPSMASGRESALGVRGGAVLAALRAVFSIWRASPSSSTRGKHAARIAVLCPLRSAWAHYHVGYQTPTGEEARVSFACYGSSDALLLARLESDLAALCTLLQELHFDFDFIDEAGLAEARIEQSRLCLGPERYELLILPSMTTCARSTWARIREFFDEGGNILSCGLLPFQTGMGEEEDQQLRREVQELTTLDPTAPDRPGGSTARAMGREAMRPLNVNREHGSRFARYLPWRVPDPASAPLLMKTLLRSLVTLDVDIDCPDLVCYQRDTADGKLFFLVNTAMRSAA